MNRVKNCVFLVRKWSYTTFNIVNIWKMWEKKGKIRRTRSMTKKKVIRNFTLKMEIFPEIGPQQKFLVPPKFGARSPPMTTAQNLAIHQLTMQTTAHFSLNISILQLHKLCSTAH